MDVEGEDDLNAVEGRHCIWSSVWVSTAGTTTQSYVYVISHEIRVRAGLV